MPLIVVMCWPILMYLLMTDLALIATVKVV